MMPLSLSPAGEENIIQRIGGPQDVRQHLKELGFVPGTPVMVISALGGNVIVKVRESRVAISDEMARRIMI